MKILRIIAAGAVIGAGAVGGTIAAMAATGHSSPTGDSEPLNAAFTDTNISAAPADSSNVVRLSDDIEVTISWDDDRTLCVVADVGNGGPGACFTEDQVAAGVAYMRYQAKETTDGLLMGIVPDGASGVIVDGDVDVEIVDNLWYAWVPALHGGSEYTVLADDGSAPVNVDVITPAEQPLPLPAG